MYIRDTIILGVVSSIIASLVFYLLMVLIKPKFIIADKICLKKVNNDEWDYIIKVVNLTHSFITNIDYSLIYCIEGKDGLKDIQTIKPHKEIIRNISKYSHKNTDYAVRLTFRINKEKYVLNENSHFIFTFQAYHSFSNAMKISKKVYGKDDLHEGIYETGKSTKILSNR